MRSILLSVCVICLLFFGTAQTNPIGVSLQAPELNKTIQQMTGKSGPATHIFLRCGPTINSNNQPLYIIDGIPWETATIKSLDPNDIEEIYVLKDAAATTLYSCRPMRGVIIITTKKALYRKLIIKDAANLTGIGSATVKAVFEKTGKQFHFTADEFGRLETDSLRSTDYTITISSTGYKTKTIGLKTILQNKGEIKLEREFIQLKELLIVAYPTISNRSISSTCSVTSLCGQIRCLAYGVSITEEIQAVKQSFNPQVKAKVYPNPVAVTGSIHISFTDVMPGQYQVRLFNTAGQLFYTVQKQIVKRETELIQLGNAIIPGIYIVQIVNEKNQLVQSSKLIVR